MAPDFINYFLISGASARISRETRARTHEKRDLRFYYFTDSNVYNQPLLLSFSFELLSNVLLK